MDMPDSRTASDIVTMVTSGGGTALLVWAITTLRSAYQRWSTMTELQEKLILAQLKALGEKPEAARELAEQQTKLLQQIRDAVAT